MLSFSSAEIDGEKKYSPPVLVTNCLTLSGVGETPGALKLRGSASWAMTGSCPSAGFGKLGLLTQNFWRNSKLVFE